MQANLTVVGGKANRQRVSLTLPVVIGRSRKAGLTIAHAMVSRRHCEIFESEGLVRIRDLGSTNGTFVGGNRVEEAVLRPHDQFTIGPLTFEVDYPCAEDASIGAATTTGLLGTSSPDSANAAAAPGSQAPAEAAPGPDAVRPTSWDESQQASLAEDFELAEQADVPAAGAAFEAVSAAPSDVEPPAQWAEPGPEIPPLPPRESAPQEGPNLASAASNADGIFPANPPFPVASETPPWVPEGTIPAAEGLELDFLDSGTAPGESSSEGLQTTSLPPRQPLHKRKTKSRWWPFGKGR